MAQSTKIMTVELYRFFSFLSKSNRNSLFFAFDRLVYSQKLDGTTKLSFAIRYKYPVKMAIFHPGIHLIEFNSIKLNPATATVTATATGITTTLLLYNDAGHLKATRNATCQ